jgi:hypothetical protein
MPVGLYRYRSNAELLTALVWLVDKRKPRSRKRVVSGAPPHKNPKQPRRNNPSPGDPQAGANPPPTQRKPRQNEPEGGEKAKRTVSGGVNKGVSSR